MRFRSHRSLLLLVLLPGLALPEPGSSREAQGAPRIAAADRPAGGGKAGKKPAEGSGKTKAAPAEASSPPRVSTGTAPGDPFQAAQLERVMLGAINQSRRGSGLTPLEWDPVAAEAGRRHAADMAEHDYFSHWDRTGYGPEYRYNLAGGIHSVMENIYVHGRQLVDGRPIQLFDFTSPVLAAHSSLMQSSGHRRNILTPEHTHVGVGFAYNPRSAKLYLVQEFVNRYVGIDPLPRTAALGATLTVTGRALPGALEPTINLAWEPFPTPMTREQLAATTSYRSTAIFYQALAVQQLADGTFRVRVPLNYKGREGVYHVRVWARVAGREVLASETLIEVR